jgi:hypothetical protein
MIVGRINDRSPKGIIQDLTRPVGYRLRAPKALDAPRGWMP